MEGTCTGFTRWAVVFLIIFVLFVLLMPSSKLTGVKPGATAI
jgi:hypothetical protein